MSACLTVAALSSCALEREANAESADRATFPTEPLAVRKNEVLAVHSSAGPYSLVVPDAYDDTHRIRRVVRILAENTAPFYG